MKKFIGVESRSRLLYFYNLLKTERADSKKLKMLVLMTFSGIKKVLVEYR